LKRRGFWRGFPLDVDQRHSDPRAVFHVNGFADAPSQTVQELGLTTLIGQALVPVYVVMLIISGIDYSLIVLQPSDEVRVSRFATSL
jgi:hypothetical protein